MSNINPSDETLPGGISGPRRRTEQPIEVAAANAEAARLAEELGFSSSSRRRASHRRSDSSSAINSSTPVIQKKRFGWGIFSKSKATSATDQSSNYRAVAPDGNVDGIVLNEPSTTSSDTKETNLPTPLSSPPPQVYSPPTTDSLGFMYDDNVSVRTDNLSVKTEELHMYDHYGNRAPYREGPYVFHHDDYGHRYKRRWCK